MNKRYGSRWSASAGFGYTWMTDFPNGPQRNPNNPGVEDRTLWTFKATGSYDAPWRHPHRHRCCVTSRAPTTPGP